MKNGTFGPDQMGHELKNTLQIQYKCTYFNNIPTLYIAKNTNLNNTVN